MTALEQEHAKLADRLADVTMWTPAEWRRLIVASQTGLPAPVTEPAAEYAPTAAEIRTLGLAVQFAIGALIDATHGRPLDEAAAEAYDALARVRPIAVRLEATS